MNANGSAGGFPPYPDRDHDAEPCPSADARGATLALLARRAAAATVCPSEVARALAAATPKAPPWREAMPAVHAAIDRLADEGLVTLSWKGKPLATRAGPYRIGRGPRG
jgi:hypothetical protein